MSNHASSLVAKRVFLHFFDIHFLEEKGIREETKRFRDTIRSEARLATRFAILSASQVLLPAASFFESSLCFEILMEFEPLFSHGQLILVGGGANAPEFIEEKLSQYGKRSEQYLRYMAAKKQPNLHPPFLPRKHSATRDITDGWLKIARTDRIGGLVVGSSIRLPQNFESNWIKAPERLGKKAFIVEHVEALVLPKPKANTLRNRLHAVINEHYFASFTRELCCGVISELVYLSASHPIPSFGNDLPFQSLQSAARQLNILKRIESATAEELVAFASSKEWKRCLRLGVQEYSRRTSALSTMRNGFLMRELAKVNIGVITALAEEFAAVCDVFDCDEPTNLPGEGAGRKYALAKVKTRDDKEQIVAIALLSDRRALRIHAPRDAQCRGRFRRVLHLAT